MQRFVHGATFLSQVTYGLMELILSLSHSNTHVKIHIIILNIQIINGVVKFFSQ